MPKPLPFIHTFWRPSATDTLRLVPCNISLLGIKQTLQFAQTPIALGAIIVCEANVKQQQRRTKLFFTPFNSRRDENDGAYSL